MKKISYNDAAYIMRRNKKHWCEKYLCNWYIEMKNNNEGYIECRAKWWAYALLFIPVHLFLVFAYMWEEGLKNYTFEPRTLHHYYTCGSSKDGDETQFGRLKIIWNQ